MFEVAKENYYRVDNNNQKALAIIKSLKIIANNDVCCKDFDLVSALEAVEDYLQDTNKIFANCH